MRNEEIAHVLAGVLTLFIVIVFGFVINGEWESVISGFVFAVVIIGVHVVAKELAAGLLDSGVEHKIWGVYRFGFKEKRHFKNEVPFGVILPLALSILSFGFLKVGSILTYETRALKRRAAKRFGPYSYTEMTDWHNGLIGATGIVALLLLSVVGYFAGFEYLSKVTAYYVFVNMIPISNLDGTQIFFGNRILWTVLSVVSVIFVGYALIL